MLAIEPLCRPFQPILGESLGALFQRTLDDHDVAMQHVATNWRDWVTALPEYTTASFAPRHVRMWEWLSSLRPGIVPPPEVEVWGRGGGKSTSVEMGCAYVQHANTRKYALYVCGVQDQADKHVGAVATILERRGVSRAVNTYGHSKGWRRQELRTADGFNVSAIGLDTAARGVKLDEYRPDLIIFDDVDARHDSPETVEKKIASITQTILPAGSPDCAVLFVQNLVHRGSIASRLADGTADFLLDRPPVKIEVAIEGLEYERVQKLDGSMRYKITGGTATWDGQSLATCESQINLWGRMAFLREAQQRVKEAEKGLWQMVRDIAPFRVTEHPPLLMAGIGLDPTCSSTGDMAGIIGAGVARVNGVLHAYVLADRSLQGSPTRWATEAVTAYHALPCPRKVFVGEKNQGGEMIRTTIQTVPRAPEVELIAVHDSKRVRAEPIQKLYEEGRVHHVGVFEPLEDELCSWEEGDPSPNRMDALCEILSKLGLGGSRGSGARIFDLRAQEP